MKDPERLRDLAGLPSQLQDALHELANNKPPAEAVARIQHSFVALPQPPVPPGGTSLSWILGSYAPVAAAVAVVTAVAALWMRATLTETRDSDRMQKVDRDTSPPPTAAADPGTSNLKAPAANVIAPLPATPTSAAFSEPPVEKSAPPPPAASRRSIARIAPYATSPARSQLDHRSAGDYGTCSSGCGATTAKRRRRRPGSLIIRPKAATTAGRSRRGALTLCHNMQLMAANFGRAYE